MNTATQALTGSDILTLPNGIQKSLAELVSEQTSLVKSVLKEAKKNEPVESETDKKDREELARIAELGDVENVPKSVYRITTAEKETGKKNSINTQVSILGEISGRSTRLSVTVPKAKMNDDEYAKEIDNAKVSILKAMVQIAD